MPPAASDKIPCESIGDLEQELMAFRESLAPEETEETWDRIAGAFVRFGAVVKGGGYNFEAELVNGVKRSSKPIISAMNSERTRLSAAALECIGTIAPRIGLTFEALVPLLVPHILRLATRPNKVYVTRSQNTLGIILNYCHVPSIIPHLIVACKESKIATGRAVALEGVLRCLNKWDWTRGDVKVKVSDIEESIRITGRDKDAGIRQTSRKVFEAYKTLFPERVDEFTGPLTPVMKKYLEIKPQRQGQNPIERVRQQSAVEKSKRTLAKPASTSRLPSSGMSEAQTTTHVHVRSASSNAVMISSGKQKSNPPVIVAESRTMPPPRTIPNHTRDASRTHTQSHNDQHQEGPPHERQRVNSTASSVYSTKSAPPGSHSSNRDHRSPARPITSQSPSYPNLAVPGSSGQARRVLKVTSATKHLDPVHKAPMRLVNPTSANRPRVVTAGVGAARPHGLVQSAGVVFPSSESGSTPAAERQRAQRVPKPIPPPSTIPIPSPSKMERPAATIAVGIKKGVKSSIFKPQDAVDKPQDGAKGTERKGEGFVPRRGGVLRPTVSQLSKQKAPTSVDETNLRGTKLGPHASRTVATRRLPVAGDKGKGGTARSKTSRVPEKPKVTPAMVPLPPSPGREMEVVPQLVPLPPSPKWEISHDGRTDALHYPDMKTAETAPKRTDESPDTSGVLTAEKISPIEAETEQRCATSEITEIDPFGVDSADACKVRDDILAREEVPTAHTPPFPSTDGESDDDELKDIEFTSGDAYTPGGSPLKTSRRPVVVEMESVSQRSPLGQVILNS